MVKEATVENQVPKINELLEPDEMQVELVPTPQLEALSYKRMQVKICNKDSPDTELFSHYFLPKPTNEEDNKHIGMIPESIMRTFKS